MSPSEPRREVAALTILTLEGRLLMIRKLRGLGQGRLLVPGGRQEPGEALEATARRECLEETGLEVGPLEAQARLSFRFLDGYELDTEVFTATAARGELRPCDEALPLWQPLSALPWGQMWPDSPLWLAPVLEGARVEAQFVYDKSRLIDARLVVKRRDYNG